MATKQKRVTTKKTSRVEVKSAAQSAGGSSIEPAKGKLGIMIPGMGAVATTFVAGVEAIRKGLAKPIGSLTQMGTIRLGKRTEGRSPKVKEFVPLAGLNDLVFTGWDIFEDNMYEAASNAGVLDRYLLDEIKPFLSSIKPRKAVFDHNYVKRIDGPNVKKGKDKMDLAEQFRDDIRQFKKSSGASRLVTVWCASTETFIEPSAAHQSIKAFENGLVKNDENIAPSMIYAYASLMEGVPFANGAPNLTVDIPAMLELSKQNEAPICGKDFKTGQTLMTGLEVLAADRCLILLRQLKHGGNIHRQVRSAIRKRNAFHQRRIRIDHRRRDVLVVLHESVLKRLNGLMRGRRLDKSFGRRTPHCYEPRCAGRFLELADVVAELFGKIHLVPCPFSRLVRRFFFT